MNNLNINSEDWSKFHSILINTSSSYSARKATYVTSVLNQCMQINACDER